ncbi:MAG: class II aldolase/adducin family protein [Halomonas sp.]|uniref:class II aldolase/adducin family protein n=1 Tax=Halomonas sp. TaxID=1486246 RepID=UPI002ACD9365|nr:class II aldolase/adducin family protein [Halomonas sp.]MDZ7852647.1 class II aldolase/adducin family protein [Halomonas sp.]
MLIKASGASFGDMDYDDIIEVSLDGEVSSCEGGKPSRESETHLAIYRCRKDVSAIFHCHSPWSVVASLSFDAWPPVSLPLEMKIGSVPVVDFGEGHADRKAADHVTDLMIAKPELKAFVQRRQRFVLSFDRNHQGRTRRGAC